MDEFFMMFHLSVVAVTATARIDIDAVSKTVEAKESWEGVAQPQAPECCSSLHVFLK